MPFTCSVADNINTRVFTIPFLENRQKQLIHHRVIDRYRSYSDRLQDEHSIHPARILDNCDSDWELFISVSATQ